LVDPVQNLSQIEAAARETFTPGPWSFRQCPCGDAVCNQQIISVQGSVGFDPADAALIAAAPELYAALEACRNRLLVKGEIGNPRDETALAKSKAALAKARGQ
jgi:hypothetical protein